VKINPGENSNQDEERKEFYKNLFRFNALLDINIDEEEFQWIPGEDKDGKKAQKNNERLIRKNLKIAFSEVDINKYQKTLIDFIRKIPNCLETKSKKRYLDINLHEIWKNFIEKKKNNSLRMKGLCLLLITKYTRALLQNDPLRKDLSEDQDALTRFASANITYVYDPKNSEESTYLQVLILAECAACASAEATIGFLRMADSTAGSKIKSSNSFKKEFDVVVPFFEALIAYNKAIAFYHSNRREEALESVQKVIRPKKLNVTNDKSTLNENELLLYLNLPALHLKADLLNKMQCCSNGIMVLIETQNSLKAISDISVSKARYKRIRARLLEALCWLDTGDRQAASESIENCLTAGGKSVRYLHSELIKELKRCKKEPWEPGKEITEGQYRNWLKTKPNLNTDAAKLILQYDFERWRDGSRDDNPSVARRIEQSETCIGTLTNFIKIHSNDRFMRQNLKEIAVDWLGELFLLREIKDGDNNTSKHVLVSDEKWREAVRNVLKSLGNETPWNKKPYFKDSDIANEIWGKHFKKFDPKKLLSILSKLTDFCEGFFHDKIHQPKKDEACNHPQIKEFLRDLVDFECKVIGLTGSFAFPEKDKECVYPKKDTYEFRHASLRGYVLKKYLECAVDKVCKPNCFDPVKKDFTWLDKEGDGVEACLRKLNESWPHEIENKENLEIGKHPTVWLKDYPKIIDDSDFRKHLQHGRSEQPINLFKKTESNGDIKNSTGIEFVALRRWNSHTPEISFSKGGGYFIFIPEALNSTARDNDQQSVIFRATKLGIVVDPGFDFIHNFFSQGFTLDDIDLVLITHADADHINDYAGLADLFRVRNKPGKNSKKIYTFIPRNAHSILNRYITHESYRPLYYDTVLVDVNEELSANEFSLKLPVGNGSFSPRMIIDKNEAECDDPCLIIRCVPASHDDHTGERPGSFGYVLTFKEHEEKIGTIGFTGDSQWFPEFAKNFEDCDLICSHMGNVLGEKMNDYGEVQHLGDWEALIRKKNHPYLPGEILFLQQLRKQNNSPKQRIVVLSEFGEELKGLIRKDVCERLNRCMVNNTGDGCWSNFVMQEDKKKNTEVTAVAEKRKEEEEEKAKEKDSCEICMDKHKDEHTHIRTIPADIGLRISIRDGEEPVVHCVLCDRFYDPEDMEWIPHGSEEAMFYVCGPCYRSKSRDIRVAKYESILDSGRPVLRSRTISEAEKSEDNN